MRFRYAVTFKFDTRPSLTHRGEVEGSSFGAMAHKATRAAYRALHPIKVGSMVVCLVERLETGVGEDGRAIVGEGREA